MFFNTKTINKHNPKSQLLSESGAGFTLIELLVSIAIMAILSGIILFTITQYINKGKDSNILGNLAVLVPAGEVYYNSHDSSYEGYCDSSVVKNAISQMPKNPLSGGCYDGLNNPAGLCCNVDDINGNKWAACVRKFSNSNNAFCVDSRGVKREIENSDCVNTITQCSGDAL
jgi:prepilin-type N-terminal cleavage/methylation domain-containing protein